MKRQYLCTFLVALGAAVLGIPFAEAGRRDPEVPIVITPPPGSITTHAEVPVSPNGRSFATPKSLSSSPIPPTSSGKK